MRSDEILAAIADSLLAIDADERIGFANPAALRLLGYEAEALLARPLADLVVGQDAADKPRGRESGEVAQNSAAPDPAPRNPSTGLPPAPDSDLLATLRATLADAAPRSGLGAVLRTGSGGLARVGFTCSAMPSGAVLVFSDVSAGGRTAELRALETRILDMLSAAAPLADVLGEIAETVDRLLPGVRSSILLVDEDGRLRHGAAPSLPGVYSAALDGTPIGPSTGSCGTAAFLRAPVTVTDIGIDPLWADFRDLALPHGLRACWSTPVMDAGGRVLATFAMYYDTPRAPGGEEYRITERIGQFVRTALERNSARAALKASEERFRTIVAHMQEVFWMTDGSKSRMLYISPAYETVWGRPCAELYARPGAWMDAVHPEDRAGLEIAVARQTEGPFCQEYRILRPDGSVRWISDRAFPVADATGLVTEIVGICQDITERRAAEFALRERLKELDSLYRILSLLSDQARPVEALCQEILDALVGGLLHRETAVAAIELGAETHRSTGWAVPKERFEVPVGHAGSREGRLVIGYRAVQPPQEGGVGPFMSEEVDMVRAVAAHIGQMLHNRRMSAQLAHAERLNAVGQISGGVAHDFNNLLTVILGNAEALSRKLAGDEKLHPLAAMTQRAAERGAELTGRLLSFARRQPLHPQATDLTGLVSGIYPMLRRLLPENVEVGLGLAEDLWPAMVDPAQLEDALLNLVLNARDAMPSGGTLTLSVSNLELRDGDPELDRDGKPGRYVLLRVADTGCGMDAATQERAFEPFFTTKPKGAGSGLGLSMVYGFAMQSRGFVRLRSAAGRGTEIALHLPCAPEGAEAAGKPVPPPVPPLPAGLRVLLVEDDDMVRGHAAEILREFGLEVRTAGTGGEALDILRNSPENETLPFDLLFTDVVMPGGMSGADLAAQARDSWPDLSVLLTSGHAEEWDPADGIPFQLLRKPYHRDELARAISGALAAPLPGRAAAV